MKVSLAILGVTALNHQLLHHLSYLALASIHVDPSEAAGDQHHRIGAHEHNGAGLHTHSAI